MGVCRYRVGAGSGCGCARRSAFTNARQASRPFRVSAVAAEPDPFLRGVSANADLRDLVVEVQVDGSRPCQVSRRRSQCLLSADRPGGERGGRSSRRTRCYGRSSAVPSGGARGIARRRDPFRFRRAVSAATRSGVTLVLEPRCSIGSGSARPASSSPRAWKVPTSSSGPSNGWVRTPSSSRRSRLSPCSACGTVSFERDHRHDPIRAVLRMLARLLARFAGRGRVDDPAWSRDYRPLTAAHRYAASLGHRARPSPARAPQLFAELHEATSLL